MALAPAWFRSLVLPTFSISTMILDIPIWLPLGLRMLVTQELRCDDPDDHYMASVPWTMDCCCLSNHRHNHANEDHHPSLAVSHQKAT